MSKVNVLISLDSDLYAAISNLRAAKGSRLDEESIINYLLAVGLERVLKEDVEITE